MRERYRSPSRLHLIQCLAAVDIDTTNHPQPTSDAMRLFADAITRHNHVTFDYSHRGRTMSRTVEPYRIVRVKGRWYHFCWDLTRADWRTFRLDRISAITPANDTFRPRPLPAEDIVSYLAEQFGGPAHLRVVLILHADAGEAASRLHCIDGALEPIDGKSCRYTAYVDSSEWLTTVLILSGLDFTIEESDEFIAYIAHARERLLTANRNS